MNESERGCRSEVACTTSLPRWAPAVAAAAFVAGYYVAKSYIENIPEAGEFTPKAAVEFDLWTSLIGGVSGFALAACIYFSVWLGGLFRLSRDAVEPGTTVKWAVQVVVVLVAVFAVLFSSEGAEEDLSNALNESIRPVSMASALLITPGLVAFLVLRSLALEDDNWLDSDARRMRLLIRLRSELHRLLATFGAFLALVVVATGVRRRALLAVHNKPPIPSEQVILYGAVFAILLGFFYTAASSAIDRRAQRFVDASAPLPHPADEALSDKLRRRNDLSVLVGTGGSWRSLETMTLIAAPLLSAVLGS